MKILYPSDPVIEENLNLIKERADRGLIKYGMSMAGNTGDRIYWLKHAREEALDLANYLTRIIQELENESTTRSR